MAKYMYPASKRLIGHYRNLFDKQHSIISLSELRACTVDVICAFINLWFFFKKKMKKKDLELFMKCSSSRENPDLAAYE